MDNSRRVNQAIELRRPVKRQKRGAEELYKIRLKFKRIPRLLQFVMYDGLEFEPC